MHPAQGYNKTRQFAFATYNKYGLDAALNVIKASFLRREIDIPSKICLDAEIQFYHQYKEDYDLEPALDAGNKCDFTGNYERATHARFDVTTNVDYKYLEDYESFAHEGKPYYIVAWNRRKKSCEILDINFPFCPECGARMIDGLILWDNGIDPFHFSDTQTLVRVCIENPEEHSIIEGNFYYMIESKKEIEGWVLDGYDRLQLEDEEIKKMADDEISKAIKEHQTSLRKWGQSLTSRPLGFVGEYDYHVLRPRGDGDYFTEIIWSHEVLKKSSLSEGMELYISPF